MTLDSPKKEEAERAFGGAEEERERVTLSPVLKSWMWAGLPEGEGTRIDLDLPPSLPPSPSETQASFQ